MIFVADVKLQGNNEVLQVPVVKSQTLQTTHKKTRESLLQFGLSSVQEYGHDTLEAFLTQAGKLFGKDPSRWDQVGDPTVDIHEEGGRRVIKTTGIFWGTELHLFLEQPFYHSRLKGIANEGGDKSMLLDQYDTQQIQIVEEQQWKQVKLFLTIMIIVAITMPQAFAQLFIQFLVIYNITQFFYNKCSPFIAI
eukprot:TRINITY_DN1068_c1_g1_i2.p1 TRINITY_DN1068_c1_g1~~TRINITY_DN1068_c1_g1_i2.p1  ORF type:complete len:193 (-),score=10.40 TRINITY_DN1068_c1_g1_i2:136-714(-)